MRQPKTIAVPRPRRVLLAEDDRALLDLMSAALRDDGYEVLEAADGLELLARLEQLVRTRCDSEPPFAIVSDIRMPGLSGIEVLALLRRACWATPVILVSAFADEDACEEAQLLGADALLAKPFEIGELRDAVRHVLPSW
jgi:two-component system response regulator (stage 0 sporulation protein F)